jgi:cation transport ATPase
MNFCLKQLSGGQDMAPVKAVKVLLATCPRALLRSTLTALTSAKTRRLGIASNKSALCSEGKIMN